MPNVLITGANRGIGLEFTRQYAGAGWRVFATCRHPAEADTLQDLASRENIGVHRLDVTRSQDMVVAAMRGDGHLGDVGLEGFASRWAIILAYEQAAAAIFM